MRCPRCQAETGDETSVFCPSCGALLAEQDGTVFVTPTASASPVVISLQPESAGSPSLKRAFTATQKLAVVTLSLAMALLVVGVGVMGYATLAAPASGSGGMPDIVPVTINDRSFPDETFRNYVAAHYDRDADGTLSSDELAAVEGIGRIDENTGEVIDPGVSALGIKSLEGMQYFVNLNTLVCPNNEIEYIDATKNKDLNYVDCTGNHQVVVDVFIEKPPAVIERDPDASVNEVRPSGDDAEEGEKGDVSAGSSSPDAPNQAPLGEPVASALTQQYENVLYAGGTLEGAWDKDGKPLAIEFDDFESPGPQTSSFLIKDGVVYYLETVEADSKTASLCRVKLGDDGLGKEVLAESVSAHEPFYCVGEYLFCNGADPDDSAAGRERAADGDESSDAVSDAGAAPGETEQEAARSGGAIRVRLADKKVEPLDSVQRFVGATDSVVLYIKEDGSGVYRCSADLTDETKVQDMVLPKSEDGAYQLCSNGNLWVLTPGASAAHLSVVTADGKSLVEKDVAGTAPEGGAWSDGENLYVADAPKGDAAASRALHRIDLATGEVGDPVPIDCGGADSVVPLYVDEEVCYVLVKTVPSETSDGKPGSRIASVVEQDRATGKSRQIASWTAQKD